MDLEFPGRVRALIAPSGALAVPIRILAYVKDTRVEITADLIAEHDRAAIDGRSALSVYG